MITRKNAHRFSRVRREMFLRFPRNRRAQVTLFSTSICPWCRAAKDFLNEHGVRYKEFDVVRNQTAFKRMIQRSGQMSVPVIEVNGLVIVGFDQNALEERLNL